MQQQKYRLIFVVACIALLVLLGLFQAIWVYGGSETSIMIQTGLQRTRVQAIAKDVLILAYRPIDERPQAVSELQNVLPGWEKTQRGVQMGDASLQLPPRVPDDVAPLVSDAQSDYTSIDTALRTIVAHIDKPIDIIEVDIILAHEHLYALEMTKVNNAWQQHIDGAFLHIFLIESVLTVSTIILIIVAYTFVSWKLRKEQVKDHEEHASR